MTMQWRTALTAGGITALLLLTGCGAPEGPGATEVPAGEVPERPSEPAVERNGRRLT